MQTSFPSRSPDSRHPRRVKRSRRGSQASCTHTARPCAASEKTAVASLPDHKKNRQPRFNRNQQYSITALTDGSGIIKERYAYSAYGTPTILDVSGIARTTSAENNRYTYTGREWDEALSLYHYRARIYDPIAGRFCSRDPIGYVGSSWNLYEFVFGRVLSLLDPMGMCPDPAVVCLNDYNNGVTGADAFRDAQFDDLAQEVIDFNNNLVDEALEQYNYLLELADQARQNNYTYGCDLIDRSTILGTIAYASCAAGAESAYYAAGTSAAIIYSAATASIAAVVAAHHLARVIGIEGAHQLEMAVLADDYADCMAAIE